MKLHCINKMNLCIYLYTYIFQYRTLMYWTLPTATVVVMVVTFQIQSAGASRRRTARHGQNQTPRTDDGI